MHAAEAQLECEGQRGLVEGREDDGFLHVEAGNKPLEAAQVAWGGRGRGVGNPGAVPFHDAVDPGKQLRGSAPAWTRQEHRKRARRDGPHCGAREDDVSQAVEASDEDSLH
ncbi:hypothetical protein GCM10009849_33080 [Sinomonas flava]|uniref:Uncharacterized protein n=1 Tax=Sinomonas flava TaxID=496857 RepID=A0ABP5NTP8_9MICC